MGLVRAFIAIEVPPAIRQAIHQKTSSLRAELGALVRWTSPENIHLTMKFLGDISAEHADLLHQTLRAQAHTVPEFTIHVGGLGAFPKLKRARVLWIGVKAPAELEALSRRIESACARLGSEPDKRGFSPHLTIGRIRQDASLLDEQRIGRALAATKIDSLGTARVDSLHLFKSDLKPEGAVYTKLFSAPFQHVIGSSHEVTTKQFFS